MRAAFVFDQERCTGCEACRVACAIENGDGRDLGWRRVHTFNPSRDPGFPTRHLSLACNHCETPACLLGCPAAAFRRDDATGSVLLDEARCVGCRYCSWLCPYDVPRWDEAAGVMTKCTFCAHRLAEGLAPACAQACPTGALGHAPRESVREEPQLLGLPALGLGPALVVRVPRPSIFDGGAGRPPHPRVPRRIRLRSEWGLALFTLVLPLLVAWFAAGLARPAAAPSLSALLGIGGAALALSALHLGKRFRALGALRNLRTSWLSREVLFSSLFLVLSAAARSLPALAPLALACGLAALVSVDAVYRAVPVPGASGAWTRAHSAEVCLTAAFLAPLIAGAPALALPAAGLKLLLLARPNRAAAARLPLPLALLRAALLVAASGAVGGTTAVILALAGEALDRGRFYLELEPVGPEQLLSRAA